MGDMLRLIKELGPLWGPPAIYLCAVYLLLKYRWDKGHRGHALFLDRWVLAAFLTGVITLAGYFDYRYRYWGLPAPFEKGEIGILIGEVPGDTNQQQQAAYAREIRAHVQETPELEAIVKVKMLDRTLPTDPQEQHTKALQWGRWLRAKFVLRPNVIEGVQKPWITVIDQPEFSMGEAPMGKFASAQLANLDQLPLPSNLVLLARCTLALACYRRGLYGHAAGELLHVLAYPDLQKPAPPRSYLCLVLGLALHYNHDFDGAIAAFREATLLEPDYPEAHFNLGIALTDNHNLDGAIVEYREALRLNPHDADAHNNLGVALHDKPDLDGAIAEYREALRLKPDDADAHNNLGVALHDKPDLDGAIAEYRTALRLNPDLAVAHNNLGNALADKPDLDEAIAEFRAALRLRQDYAVAHYNLASALHDKHDLDGAIAENRAALRLNPVDAMAHFNLASALHEKDDLNGAITEYREAARLNPNLADAHNNLAWILATSQDPKYRDPQAALTHARRAVDLMRGKEKEWEFMDTLAEAYFANGNYRRAVDIEKEALELNPNDQELREHLSRYRKAAAF